MATLVPTINASGITSPDYDDILQELKIAYWSIYGADANLDSDTQDGQLLSVFALAIFNCNQTAIAIYNSFSPTTAQGAGLSSVVKINGLARLVPTNSQCVVSVGGGAGTTINGGIVGDNENQNTRWTLPDVVTIPIGGTIDVTATCTEPGSIVAGPGTLTRILTPTRGWQSVTNAASAIAGNPVENDAQLRLRQAASTAFPAQTILDGIFGAVANIIGVKRLRVYENDTAAPDGNGIPSHSISVVAEGGDVQEIAAAIAAKKSPGTGTYGDIAENVVDEHGVVNVIHFYEAATVPITVEVDIEVQAGYVSSSADAIKAAIADFINALTIGGNVYNSRCYSPANLGGVGPGATFVVTAIKLARASNLPPAVRDIAITFHEAAICSVADVTVVTT